MKRRGFLKGLGLVTGGAALIPSDFLRANDDKTSDEPPYDIKIVTNIIDSEEAWCIVSENVYESAEIPYEFVRKTINKDGIVYITLPDSMKFKYVDIAVFDLAHNYTRIFEYYITDTPHEIMIFSSIDRNYYDVPTTKKNLWKNGGF